VWYLSGKNRREACPELQLVSRFRALSFWDPGAFLSRVYNALMHRCMAAASLFAELPPSAPSLYGINCRRRVADHLALVATKLLGVPGLLFILAGLLLFWVLFGRSMEKSGQT